MECICIRSPSVWTMGLVSSLPRTSPVPGNVQGQVAQGLDEPGVVGGVPAHCRGVGTR